MKQLYYIFAILLLASCSSDILSPSGESEGGSSLEITTINAYVDGSGVVSRAISLGDTVGRKDFVADDVITFTEIKRTLNPIEAFTYTQGIIYNRSAENSWIRTKTEPERIYWSDANSAHTFKGYGCPQDANGFDWNAETEQGGLKVYFGSLGDPTHHEATDSIDYTNDPLPTELASAVPPLDSITKAKINEHYKSGNNKIIKDDILLAYNEEQMADAGGQVATVRYYHGLCNVRVIVNISGFSASADAVDSRSVVTGLVLENMLTMYKWNQESYHTAKLIAGDQTHLNAIYPTNTPEWNQKKNIKTWIRHPEGNGTGQSKTFTFYALAVPDTEVNQHITFNVTYPDPLHPTTNTTRKYSASISGIEYRAGYCTTIHISLNHKNDQMTVGAEYDDWEFVETPDQTNLKKNATMLTSDMLLRTNYTIAGDQKATKDDATWLYYDTSDDNKLKDIYGNDGTMQKPFIICTAQQLVSFMEEVKSGNNGNGRSFAGQFIKLDADLTLQSQIETPKTTIVNADGTESTIIDREKLITWPGIGSGDNVFNGFFLGSNRHINNLYGEAFFTTVGSSAVIDKLDFANMIEVQGSGIIADINNGLICACAIEGNILQKKPADVANSYCGSFVGDNKSFIIACTHKGEVAGYGYVGGFVGRNDGTMIASYHTGLVKFAGEDSNNHNVGGSTGFKDPKSQVFSCYFNSSLIQHKPSTELGKVAWGRTTAQMQSNSFVNHTSLGENKYYDIIGNQEVTIDVYNETELFKNRFCLNDALQVFLLWLQSKPQTGDVTTNTRTFTQSQIQFLQAHYSSAHSFQYTPGAYPKVQ